MHENKEASIDFRLSLRDVCWDLPLTAPVLAEAALIFKAEESSTFTFQPMDTQWGDYCGGFTYEIVYVSGDFVTPPDLDSVFTVGYPVDSVNGRHEVTTLAPDLTWLGTHTFFIRGQNGGGSSKEYNTVDSDTFTITWNDPCIDNEVTLV